MSVLLLGCNGQVGWELQRSLTTLGPIVALDRRGRDGMVGDLADLEGLRRTVRRVRPRLIVNAAAYTAVDLAEQNLELAARVNTAAPALLADEAAGLDALLVHYSTDYVFDGSGNEPWRECDQAAPLSVYGKTKLDGELAIQASGCQYLIFRTSWVFASRGHNFLRTMLRLLAEKDALNVVSDQIGAPTPAELIADVSALAARHVLASGEEGGLYHLSTQGETSWHGYATFVAEQMRLHGHAPKVAKGAIRAIPTSAYPTPARRPLNSRLDTIKLCDRFNLTLPGWQQSVERALAELLT